MALEDAIRPPKGLRENDRLAVFLHELDSFTGNVGLFIELAKGALEVRLAADPTALGKPPFGLNLGRGMGIKELREVKRLKASACVRLLVLMVFYTMPPKLGPERVKRLGPNKCLLGLGHVLQEDVEIVWGLQRLLAAEKLGLGHAVLAPNHED